jgi:hypothetical protein
MKSVAGALLHLALAWPVAGMAGVADGAPLPPGDLPNFAGGRTGLPLGAPGLAQRVTVERLAPGVAYYKVQRGAAAKTQSWYLLGDVLQQTQAPDRLKGCFAKLGLRASVTVFSIPGAGEHSYRIVSGGSWPSRAAAAKAAKAATGCQLYPRHSSEDTADRGGPWSIHIIAVAPGTRTGRWLAAANGNGPVLRERTSELARSAHALVAVNGGFFVEGDADGVPGQAAGISMLSGRVNGAPVAHRPALVLRNDPVSSVAIARDFGWQAWLAWADGKRTLLDGVNRQQGKVRNCGRSNSEPAIHDYTCRYEDDLVYYPAGSKIAQALPGDMQFAIDTAGNVRKLGAGEMPQPSDALLAGGAKGARNAGIEQQIARHVTAAFQLESNLLSDFGNDISVVNAGPTLLMRGEYVREDAAEGWAPGAVDDPAHRLLMHDWINRRNPRTALGIRKDGTVLLVVVDGHRHGSSVGLTIEELRLLMKALGARDAVNLDGGGSSAMVVRERLVNSPSDSDGERKVGDAILFTADKQSQGTP